MTPGGDVIVADIYCIYCGQSLRLGPAGGPCPGCGGFVADSLRETILAGGHRHVRRVGRALQEAAYLNIALAVGCVLNPLTMLITRWYSPLSIVFVLSVAIYAWLQAGAGMQAALPRPGERATWRRVVILIGGSCFLAAALAALAATVARAQGITGDWLAWTGTAGKALLFGLPLFWWALGGVYERLCSMGGLRRLRVRCKIVTYLNVCGSLMLAAGCSLLPVGADGLPIVRGTEAPAIPVVIAGAGLMVILLGLAPLTLIQFQLGGRLRDLADTLGDRTVLTGRPVE